MSRGLDMVKSQGGSVGFVELRKGRKEAVGMQRDGAEVVVKSAQM